MPANSTLSQQQRFHAGYYDGYDAYCHTANKGGDNGNGNDNCPAVSEVGMALIPDQQKSRAYNQGFSDGFIGIKVPGPHTQQYMVGYKNGIGWYWDIRGAIIPGYIGKPPLPLVSLPPDVNRSYYLSWYDQAKHFHIDDGENISIPSHTDDDDFAYYEGIQDGMLVYDQDHNRGNGDTNASLGHSNQAEYTAGFNSGYDIEYDAEEAD